MKMDCADAALAGLALVEAAVEDNPTNRNNLLDSTDNADLIVGLVLLASTLRKSLAVAWAISELDLDEQLRAMYLHHSADFTGGAV